LLRVRGAIVDVMRHNLVIAVLGSTTFGAAASMDMEMAEACKCKFQGTLLNASAVAYAVGQGNTVDTAAYGTTCAAWDSMPGTPWFSSCDPTTITDWSGGKNWCQTPWCYVDSTCPNKTSSSLFGSDSGIEFFSYYACGKAPNCYSDPPDAGCPFNFGDTMLDYMISKDSCPCTFAGSTLPEDIYMNYPSSNPGAYAELANIQYYGTTCAAWDTVPDTPWYSYCPMEADWCHQSMNWCVLPWCYVSEECTTKIESSAFAGSSVAYYSYDTCMSTPDCYTNSDRLAWDDLPESCPFDSSDSGWSTPMLCEEGYTGIDTCSTIPTDMATKYSAPGCA
jgi:hypothetical protein